MPPAQVAPPAVRYLQGIAVPAESVRPIEFFARTRRHIVTEANRVFAGAGGQDIIELRKSDILSGILIRFTGSLVITTPTGAVNSTARWPYDLLRQCRFTANGASNIINASGLKLKVRDFMTKGDLTDRGVSQSVGGTARTQGTLSQASESWGVGSQQTAIAAGTYPVDLEWYVPVAEDSVDLAGAIFAATSSTDLTLTMDWETIGNLFAITGTSTVALTGSLNVVSQKHSIPLGSDGQIVVPDLSVFHSLIQARTASGIANGENELRVVGQGAGKSLLRMFFQTYNGAAPQAPLAMTDANYGPQRWRYGANETPDDFVSGSVLRQWNERTYSVDIGGIWGFGCHDFAAENAFRDAVDMGTASELRIVTNIANGVTLVNPSVEYVVETIFQAGAGA